ncbi:AraC family transcriptional regulator [Moraxella bovoculi]|uniref:AraC family transcriptional regulator n=1 Tax=Moraxella bovoculi TaxID=386891 RepID=UPI0009BBCF58|nr:AraC family transcriptional regulator [Moraxella bovoculi]
MHTYALPQLQILGFNKNSADIQYLVNDFDSFITSIQAIIPLLDLLSSTVFFIKNTQAQYMAVNQTLKTRLDVNNDAQIIGRTPTEMFGDKQGREYMIQDLKVLEGSPIVDRLELHTYPSGKLGWCITHKIPIYNKTNEIIAIVGVSIDIDKDNSYKLKAHEKLAVIINYMQDNAEHKITINKLATIAGLSISGLERLFRSVLNLSPQQMLQKIRLEKAVKLLQNPNESVIEIAIQCGYTDHSAFSRQFKQLTGLSPSDFRKRMI